MDLSKKINIVDKIIELRVKYAIDPEITLTPIKFNNLHDKLSAELRQISKDLNIGIDTAIIFATQSKFEEYLESGLINEFIRVNGAM